MIITRDAEAKVESTFEGERVKMGFDEAAMANIMAILSEQYSDTELAPVREYTTNGIDAQVEHGWFRPVELCTPSWDSATFSIQDFGVGMNADIIRDVYANYGASTKRLSNDFNGSMGIGSKSAFAYTNQFTVESNRDGVKTVVVVSRDDDGGGDMTIVSETPTDDLSGTKVTIPVANIYSFAETIKKFAKRLAPGLALVDGEDLSEWGSYTKVMGAVRDDSGKVIINGIYHTDQVYYGSPNDRVYMGGVSYPALKPLCDVRTDPAYNIMVDIPLGDVQFSPSRESLKDVRVTRETLEKVGKIYHEHLSAQVKKDIDGAKSLFEAIAVFQKNKKFLTHDEQLRISYDGVNLYKNIGHVRLTVVNGKYESFFKWQGFNADGGTRGRSASKTYSISIGELHKEQPLFIKGYTGKSVAGAHKNKIQYWAENFFDAPKHFDDGLPREVYLFNTVPDEINNHDVLSKMEWIEWEDIAKIKLPRNSAHSTSRPSMAGKRYVFEKGGYGFELKDVASCDSKHIFYSVGTAIKEQLRNTDYSALNGGAEDAFARLVSGFLYHQADDAIFVNVYANSEKKFLSEFPKAVKIETSGDFRKPEFDKKFKVFEASVKDSARWPAIYNSKIDNTIQYIALRLGIDSIDDPALRMLHCNNTESADTFQFRDSKEHYAKAVALLEEAQEGVHEEIRTALACYPMLSVVQLNGYSETEHFQVVVDYLNATYNNKENK